MNANNLFLAIIYMEHYLGTKEEKEAKGRKVYHCKNETLLLNRKKKKFHI